MKTLFYTQRWAAFLVILGVAFTVVFISMLYFKNRLQDRHSSWSHVLRWVNGEWGGKQIVDDLAADLSQSPFLNDVHSWSFDTIKRFNSGEIKCTPYSAPWDPVVELASNDVPSFVDTKWKDKPDYEVCLNRGRAESILIDWYSHGIVIGETNYDIRNSRWDGHYNVCVQPGVYVVWYDCK